MADYISQFTGSEIDSRLAKVSQLESGKQDNLVSGTNIKTINGQSVLGGGNLQIQAGDTDAVKYVSQELTDAQKAQARANIDAASLEDIQDMDFVTATTLPTASASTMGHIYLIGPDANDNYDRYFTQESGGSYSWIPLGSTQIDLSTYATQEELTQLEHEVLNYVNNPEYIFAYTDSDGRFLFGIKPDGSIEWEKGVPQPIRDLIPEEIEARKQFTDEQKTELVELLSEYFSREDAEGRIQIIVDNDEKVIAYRKGDGTLVEGVGVETPTVSTDSLTTKEISISDTGLDSLIQDLQRRGLTGGAGDWSGNEKLSIPTPRCAVINFTSSDGNPASWPTTKTVDFQYWMQFWDMQGNYFRKRVIFNAQGNSSLGMPKKNGAIDLCNDEWEGDDTFELKIGDWIPQDSFHLKAYYADYFVGVAVVGYEVFDQMTKSRDIYKQRDWIKYLVPSKETIGVDSQATDGLSDNLTMHNDARCYPDGFPCLVYLDNTFFGVYSFQLKKHRDNYQMDKSNADEIHLDGMISYDSIFEADGTLPWGVINGTETAPSGGLDGIEVRNPKSLICADGTKYDADTNRKELIGTSSPGYDASNANMVRTAQVRASMEQLSTYIPTLQAMASGGSTNEQIRAKIAECFDVGAIIDYQIFGDVLGNIDGFRKNWQWVTWDGTIWMPEPYDMDALLGWTGWVSFLPNLSNHYGNSMSLPTGWVINYYQSELELRYKELRDLGILTKGNIVRLLQDWVARIGTKNFKKNHELWPYDQAHYSYATEYTRVDSIFRVSNWIEQRIIACDTLYHY